MCASVVFYMYMLRYICTCCVGSVCVCRFTCHNSCLVNIQNPAVTLAVCRAVTIGSNRTNAKSAVRTQACFPYRIYLCHLCLALLALVAAAFLAYKANCFYAALTGSLVPNRCVALYPMLVLIEKGNRLHKRHRRRRLSIR